jgi:hypothetical protein
MTTILELEHCVGDTVADADGTVCLVVIQNALSPHHMSHVTGPVAGPLRALLYSQSLRIMRHVSGNELG